MEASMSGTYLTILIMGWHYAYNEWAKKIFRRTNLQLDNLPKRLIVLKIISTVYSLLFRQAMRLRENGNKSIPETFFTRTIDFSQVKNEQK